jgi:hypothetical protein
MIEFLEVIIPLLIAFVGILIPAIRLYLDNRKLKNENNNLNEKIKDLSLDLEIDLQVFNDVKDIAENILFKTKADRFLILTATNGTRDMRFATAVYEQHKKTNKVVLSLGATGKYVKFEFDSSYKKMLKEAEIQGSIELQTEKMGDCDLKSIYENESVKFSDVHFLMRGKIDELNDRLFYCSIATHENAPFTKIEKLNIKSNIDKLKYILKKIDDI